MISYKIIKINAIDSSNNEIKRLYHKKLHTNGLVVWAKSQTEGRGQGSKKETRRSVCDAKQKRKKM